MLSTRVSLGASGTYQLGKLGMDKHVLLLDKFKCHVRIFTLRKNYENILKMSLNMF